MKEAAYFAVIGYFFSDAKLPGSVAVPVLLAVDLVVELAQSPVVLAPAPDGSGPRPPLSRLPAFGVMG